MAAGLLLADGRAMAMERHRQMGSKGVKGPAQASEGSSCGSEEGQGERGSRERGKARSNENPSQWCLCQRRRVTRAQRFAGSAGPMVLSLGKSNERNLYVGSGILDLDLGLFGSSGPLGSRRAEWPVGSEVAQAKGDGVFCLFAGSHTRRKGSARSTKGGVDSDRRAELEVVQLARYESRWAKQEEGSCA
ncbi:hypothetical protein BD289DRAFT_277408 [Coniella lustricola]|uniref:Uncharacterized protein n=1 Tax=Coniella lustricola TaxID=2025994 RepID=A0A2T3A6F9_9PEZI|nr:hypothetical protein BD289DRAFT_277408 [Coniella lustricola]